MFITADNARASGEDVKRFRCCVRPRTKLENGETSHTLGGPGEGDTYGDGSGEVVRGL